MPKIKYTQKVEFAPDCLNSDPQNDSNEIEPEEYKYGIYYNDGYDYMKHLVSMEDFLNISKDLKSKEVITKKPNPMSLFSQAKKSATVIKEFEVYDEGFDDKAVEKLKEIADGDIDEDILNALNSDAELSDLENDFVDIANGVALEDNIKGDVQLFNRFLGNVEETETESDNNVSNFKDFFDFSNNISVPLNEMAENLNFENNFNQLKQFQIPSSDNSNSLPLAFLNAFESVQNKAKQSILDTVGKEVSEFNRNLYKGETEYNKKEIEQAVQQWTTPRNRPMPKRLGISGKVSEIKPIIVTIPRSKKTVSEKMEEDISNNVEKGIKITNVSKFHIQRPDNETNEEKRERKNAIKNAKRSRTEEKKISRNTFKKAKLMF